MIPHLLSGTIYTAAIGLTCPSARELHEFSTFDAFRDAFEWIEGDGFRYALVPVAHRGRRFDIAAYINVDEGLVISDRFDAFRVMIRAEMSSRGRGIRIANIGKPQFFLRLNSIDKKIADAEETRNEKIFIDLIDS